MFFYFFKRILWAFPTLLLISLLVFGLTKCTADDPVIRSNDMKTDLLDWETYALDYKEKAAFMGLDKPAFYCTIQPAAYPSDFGKILPPERRDWYDALLSQTGKTKEVFAYATSIETLSKSLLQDSISEKRYAGSELRRFLINADLEQAKFRLHTIIDSFPSTKSKIEPVLAQISTLQTRPNYVKLYTPSFIWHGFDNQYHHWVAGMFRGEWGTSYHHKIKVWTLLKPLVWRTLLLNGLSLILAIFMAIPLGLWLAKRGGTQTDSRFQTALIGLHAMPVIWIGSILILVFATPVFGMKMFGFGFDNFATYSSVWSWFAANSSSLALPIFCQSMLAVAVLALQMRSSALEVSKLDYVRTARAKGLPEQLVWRRHILPNALFPMITLFSGVLPALFSGSILIEYMFDIPAMGAATYEAFGFKDHPILFAIIMIVSFLTIFGTLLADLLYAWADPRVRF